MRCERWKNAFARRRRRFNAEARNSRRRVTHLRKSRGRQSERWQPRDFCFYLRPSKGSRTGERFQENRMAIFSRLIFETVQGARRRLSCSGESHMPLHQKSPRRPADQMLFQVNLALHFARHIKERPVRFDVVAIEEFPRPIASATAAQERVLPADVSGSHWKIQQVMSGTR